MGAKPLTLAELIWKFSADGWAGIEHLSDPELIEYLFRISNGAFRAIIGQIPDWRLSGLVNDLDMLLAKSRKGGRSHQLMNEWNCVREGKMREAVRQAHARWVIVDNPLPKPPAQEPPQVPEPMLNEDDRFASAFARLERLRRQVSHDRRVFCQEIEILRREIEILHATRIHHSKEAMASKEEYRRTLVKWVAGLALAAVTGLVAAILGLKS